MRTNNSLLMIAMAVIGLATAPLACTDDGGNADAENGTSGDGDGDGDPASGDGDGDASDFDEAATITAAQDYKNWNKVNVDAFLSTGHDGGMATVNVYVQDATLAQYKAIDPAAPAETTFAEGTIIVKEHVDDMGNYAAATIMAKGPAGYSEGSNDWWWGMGDLVGGELTAMGPDLMGCIGCHSPFTVTDWVIGVPLDNQAP